MAGDLVEFIAAVEPYWREDGSKEFGLFKCKVIE